MCAAAEREGVKPRLFRLVTVNVDGVAKQAFLPSDLVAKIEDDALHQYKNTHGGRFPLDTGEAET